MNKLPSLPLEILGQVPPKSMNEEQNRLLQPKVCKPANAQNNCMPVSGEMYAFKPIKIVGDISWAKRNTTGQQYAWTPVKKYSGTSANESNNDITSLNEDHSEESKSKQKEMVDSKHQAQPEVQNTTKELPESKNVLDDPLFLEFESKFTLNRPKPASDKRLAVRSDVVNKT